MVGIYNPSLQNKKLPQRRFYNRIKNEKVDKILLALKRKIKMNTKDIIIIVLVLVLIGFAGLVYYLYLGVMECKATATGLGAKLQECGVGLDQYEAGLNECMTGAETCQDALTGLTQIPACAPYILAE